MLILNCKKYVLINFSIVKYIDNNDFEIIDR